jgi:Trk K+ transport system NAD-binding subunit
MDGPVIVCGLGRVGKRILDYLLAAKLTAVVVNARFEPGDLPPGVRGLTGDCRSSELLREAGIGSARGVIVCTSDDLVNIATALTARRLNPSTRIVVRTFNQNLVPRLGKAVANTYALSVSALGAPILALTALAGEMLGAVQLPDGPRQIASLPVEDGGPLAGRRVCDVAERHALLPLAVLPASGEGQYLLDVPAHATLRSGERLVVCGSPREVAQLLGTDDAGPLPALRLASLRRLARSFGRALADVELPVMVATAVLVAVLIASTVVYHYGAGDAWASALYHAVSVIATAADLRADTYPAWMKTFVSGLRIAGAALTAAFTAIVTQYLLRARFGAAFETRRIPDGGHVVVCGLGNIGFRVVEVLLKAGEKVVAVEASRDGRFLASARRLGAAVVIGDATVVEVLRQVRVGSAKAIVAATGNELANVEVALLVREMSPESRVVVRLSDAEFAEALREGANVRLALSVPALAAPAFVAALFGDRVQSVVRIGGRLFLVVDLVVSPGDSCLEGQTVRAVAVDYGLMPVAVRTGDGKPADRRGDRRLAAGDVVTAVTGLPELERLFRREPAPADHCVEVTRFPLSARAELVRMLCGELAVDAAAAEALLAALPCVAKRGLTRGQAEDWVTKLTRERVDARALETNVP